jgi:hypothetical protein
MNYESRRAVMSPAKADRANIHPIRIVILGKNAYENTTGSATHNEMHQEQVTRYARWEPVFVLSQTKARTGSKISSIVIRRVTR